MKMLNILEVVLVSGGMFNVVWMVMGWVLGEIIYNFISVVVKDYYGGLN